MVTLGSYEILGQIGAGNDAVAYRARDGQDKSHVEVRVLRSAVARSARWQPLSRRIRLAAMLSHPGASRVREVGLDDEPFFVVMDCAEARSLSEVVELELDVDSAVSIAHDLAEVCAAAHAIGLVHGDLRMSRVRIVDGARVRLDFLESLVSDSVLLDTPQQLAELRGPGWEVAHPADDLLALGAIFDRLLVEARPTQSVDPSLRELIASMTRIDAADQPDAVDVCRQVQILLRLDRAAPVDKTVAVANGAVPLASDAQPGDVLGRFRLAEQIGRGGMGTVYRAEDLRDGAVVAVKILNAEFVSQPDALKRFRKEARLLSEVENPHVTRLIEMNRVADRHYLVMEYVEGESLAQHLGRVKSMNETTAVKIMADVAKGLADVHERGIIHRDVKPENILLIRDAAIESDPRRQRETPQEISSVGEHVLHDLPAVKLADFGLARYVHQTDSLKLTRPGSILGTPLYMAPEQCSGQGDVSPATDVYAMGATLYHMLAGRPPFESTDPFVLVAKHCNEAPLALNRVRTDLSEAISRIVQRALEKSPSARHVDASDLLRELDGLLHGETTNIDVHPKLPKADSSKVLRFDFEWDLEASPAVLWPHVSNTDRVNQAMNLPPVEFRTEYDGEGGTRRFGHADLAGMKIEWEEHPYEWIEARRMGVLREFTHGPFEWFVSIVELLPARQGGTSLRHQLRIKPRGLVGKLAASVEIGMRARRALDRIYRRIDACMTHRATRPTDPFREPAKISGRQRRRLEAALDRVARRGADLATLEHLGDFLAHAPSQEVARIRPLAVARHYQLDSSKLVTTCLYSATEGLLQLKWDLICPICRVSTELKDTLQALREHGDCEVCHLDFTLDFASSIELVFQAHPEIRDIDLRTYCIGGPAHAPHIVAQLRLAARERFELPLSLDVGAYVLRGPQLASTVELEVRPWIYARHATVRLGEPERSETAVELAVDRQTLTLFNSLDDEVLIRLERTNPRAEAFTAAAAAALPIFRALFPGEMLSPGQLISISSVILIALELTDADRLYREKGDSHAFEVVHTFLTKAVEHIHRHGGAVVKVVGQRLLASIVDIPSAARIGLDLAAMWQREPFCVRVSINRGAALTVTINDSLEYFGGTVNDTWNLLKHASAGQIVMTEMVATDPEMAEILAQRCLECEVLATELHGVLQDGIRRLDMRSNPTLGARC